MQPTKAAGDGGSKTLGKCAHGNEMGKCVYRCGSATITGLGEAGRPVFSSTGVLIGFSDGAGHVGTAEEVISLYRGGINEYEVRKRINTAAIGAGSERTSERATPTSSLGEGGYVDRVINHTLTTDWVRDNWPGGWPAGRVDAEKMGRVLRDVGVSHRFAVNGDGSSFYPVRGGHRDTVRFINKLDGSIELEFRWRE